MNKDPKIFIEHILQCIEHIQQYLKGISKERFFNSLQLQDAVIRRLEIIGEAVKNIPQQTKHRYTDIPWRQIAGMRDVLIHAYLGVDLELTWRVATKALQDLKNSMLKLKKDLDHKQAE